MDFAGLGSLMQIMASIELNKAMVSSITAPMMGDKKQQNHDARVAAIREMASQILKEDPSVKSFDAAFTIATKLYDQAA